MKFKEHVKTTRMVIAIDRCWAAVLVLNAYLAVRERTVPRPILRKDPASRKVAQDCRSLFAPGTALCRGDACHGSTIPRTKLKLGQNDFSTCI